MLKSEYEHMTTQLSDKSNAIDDDAEFYVAFEFDHACVTLHRFYRCK